jgi:hypothetical protein
MASQPFASYRLARKAPMMVERRWPAWNGLAMLGDEKSSNTRLPAPEVLVP